MSEETRKELEEVEEELESSIPELNFASVDLSNYEEVEPGEEAEREEGPSREELLRQVQEYKEQALRGQESQGTQAALMELVQTLKDQPRGQQQQQGVPQQRAGESDEDFAKRFQEELFEGENAFKNIQELVKRTVGPAFGAMGQSNVELSREVVQTSPKYSTIWDRYSKEIEEEVQQTPMENRPFIPNIYQKAAEKVRARHLDELQSEKLEELVEKRVMEELEKRGLGKKKESPPPNFSESGGNFPSRRGKDREKVRFSLTPAQKAYAAMRGISGPQLFRSMQNQPGLKEKIENWAKMRRV